MFMDGPFGFSPQRRRPGLFNQPPAATANASPATNDVSSGPGGTTPGRILPGSGGAATNALQPNQPQPMNGSPAQSMFQPGGAGGPGAPGPMTAPPPGPYSYNGPSMKMLTDQDVVGMANQPAAPAAPFMGRFNGFGGGGGWRRRMMMDSPIANAMMPMME